MSRAPREAINVPDAGIASIGNDQYPPQSGPNQASHEMSNFVDGSGPIFSMYLEMATEEDKKMAEGWKADADGILFFVRPSGKTPTLNWAHFGPLYRKHIF
ncbi:hypothetical protein EDB83DRAFT_2523433 [Lactarius deliciosus]|nr:hypothetical protein EDB83DRAFT_2523433 [Lactarius deliciosus]